MKYMEVDEMVSFYNALKDAFKKKNVSSGVYMKLQKIVAKEIKNRNKKELDYIIKHYLKEDVLFLM